MYVKDVEDSWLFEKLPLGQLQVFSACCHFAYHYNVFSSMYNIHCIFHGQIVSETSGNSGGPLANWFSKTAETSQKVKKVFPIVFKSMAIG